jgi:hypothetical protein
LFSFSVYAEENKSKQVVSRENVIGEQVRLRLCAGVAWEELKMHTVLQVLDMCDESTSNCQLVIYKHSYLWILYTSIDSEYIKFTRDNLLYY